MKKITILIIGIIVFTGTSATFNQAILSKERAYLLPVGDSITNGDNGDDDDFGYRDHLQDYVGKITYDFRGDQSSPSSSSYDNNHSGVDGDRTDEIESRIGSVLSTYMSSSPTDSAVLLHVGTNDVAQTIDPGVARDNVEDIIDIINAHDSSIDVYVSLIIPFTDARDSDATTLNTSINTMLGTYQGSKSNLYIVDMNSSFKNDTSGLCSGDWSNNCMANAAHPNDTGYQAMAWQWAKCIEDKNNANCNGN